jgi:hypothetical protein
MKLDSLINICQTLEKQDVKFLIVGGIAVIAHGYTRLTMDIDMVISLEETNIRNALNVFADMGYKPRIPVNLLDFADQTRRDSWIKKKNMTVFSLICEDFEFPPIDIFVSEPFDFQTEYRNAKRYDLDDTTSIPIVSLPTLIKMKEKANRTKDKLYVSCLRHFLDGVDHEAD